MSRSTSYGFARSFCTLASAATSDAFVKFNGTAPAIASATIFARSRFVGQAASCGVRRWPDCSILKDRSVSSARVIEHATNVASLSPATTSGSPGPLNSASTAAHPAPTAGLSSTCQSIAVRHPLCLWLQGRRACFRDEEHELQFAVNLCETETIAAAFSWYRPQPTQSEVAEVSHRHRGRLSKRADQRCRRWPEQQSTHRGRKFEIKGHRFG